MVGYVRFLTNDIFMAFNARTNNYISYDDLIEAIRND